MVVLSQRIYTLESTHYQTWICLCRSERPSTAVVWPLSAMDLLGMGSIWGREVVLSEN